MLNKIIHASLDNRVIVLIVTGLILIAGTVALIRSEVDIFPDLNAPTVVVMTEAAGMAPEEVERQVSFPIETAVNGATGVRRVRSSSSTGFSVVWVEFDWDTDIYRARQIVSEKIAGVGDALPPGAGRPTLGPQSSILGEMMIVGLTSDSISQEALRTLADRTIRPRLLSVKGVSQVAVIGGDVREYQIRLNPDKMRMHGVSLSEALEASRSLNNNASGGVLYEYGNEYLLKADIATADTTLLAAGVVKSTGDTIVTLADIASVGLGRKEPRLGAATVDTKPAVLLTVTKQPGTGSIGLTEDIDAAIGDLRGSMPESVNVVTDIFRQSDFIGSSITNLQVSLAEGALFVIIVLFFFLMNLRTTLISVVALPLSIIVTVLILNLLGLSINTMTLGGIAIAIGSLVDDAIVDVENVHKRLLRNRALPAGLREPVLTVVYNASKEVRMPIFNSSLIIMASFLPLFFLTGIEGRMLVPLGISFIVALIASTIVALTVTPVLCSYLLGSGKGERELDRQPWLARKLGAFYARTLRFALAHPKVILWSTGGLFAVSVALFFTLGRSFLPAFNEGSFTINLSALPGISLDQSDAVGREAERIIMSVPEVKRVARKTGRAELDEHSLGVNVSELEVPYSLDHGRTRREVANELRGKLRQLPGVNVEIGQPISHRIDAMLSGSEAQIAVKIFGDDLDRLYATGLKIKKEMEQTEGIVDINIEQQTPRPQIDIRPRRELLARNGIPTGEFAEYIRVMLGGEVVSQVFEEGIPSDITVKLDDSRRHTKEDIENMAINSTRGMIPLGSVADVVYSAGPNTINREDVSRRIVVSANTDGRDLRGAVDEIRSRIERNVDVPAGYRVAYGGQFENEARASRTLALASLGALLIIFMLLYAEFRNVRQALIILVNMPLAMIGGVLILRLTGSELNIPAIIGFISLIGISTRNGMLLMSRYNSLKDSGTPLRERVLTGSEDRLNPIMMTALTSALALIPLALRGSEPGNEIQSPLAIVILGGLLSSTLLNIYVVPVIYSLTEKIKGNKDNLKNQIQNEESHP